MQKNSFKKNFKKELSHKEGYDIEWQDYEYDITNDDGETFHVTVHREIIKESPKTEEV